MKQTLLAAALMLLFGACLHAQEAKVKGTDANGKKTKLKQEGDKVKMKGDMAMPAIDLPYTAAYSSQFVMGKPEQAKYILDLYKSYETGTNTPDNPFADTITFILPEGQLLKGADAVSSAFMQQRSQLSSVNFDISAVIPVHSVDRNTDWVLVWGVEHVTPSSGGSAMNVEFHSIWNINADGKLAFVQMYEGKAPQ